MSLKTGSAVVDITPEKSMFLVGYPKVQRMSEGAHDPLLASALYLEKRDCALLMIAVDLLFMDAKTISGIRREIAAQTNLDAANIMISCTHTHSGPVTVDMLSFRHDPVVPQIDLEYMNKLKKLIVAAGVQAAAAAALSEMATASANIDGVGCNRHDPDGPRDPEAGILVFRSPKTKKIAAISLIYCMHPTVLHEDSKFISADFPGYTREYLKSCFGADVTILYHTGPEGNLSPRYDVRGQTFAEAKRLGDRLGGFIAEKVSALTDSDYETDPVLDIAGSRVVPVRRALPNKAAAAKNLTFRRAEYARLQSIQAGHGPVRTAECAVFGAEELYALAEYATDGTLDAVLADYKDVEVQALRVGGVCIVAFPGEIFVEFSLELKAQARLKSFAVCLANGEMQGYIASETATGYEADNSLFAPETGDRMVQAALKIINNQFYPGA